MSILLIIIHVIACIAIIMVVLLQTGKGADMGAAFGGSSQTLFGSTGASTFLSKATTVVAIIFMITSLSLAYMSGNRNKSSIMEKVKIPVEQKAAPDSNAIAIPSGEQTAPAALPDTGEKK
ncbi:preprotein translocase subunit SecG [Desulfobacterium sp. N47]|uniref:preprotein translocase subunit SecG n=1 Tax=Desulfobacterium sp. N47 TaxID=3115210 RepID=UPI003F4A38E4